MCSCSEILTSVQFFTFLTSVLKTRTETLLKFLRQTCSAVIHRLTSSSNVLISLFDIIHVIYSHNLDEKFTLPSQASSKQSVPKPQTLIINTGRGRLSNRLCQLNISLNVSVNLWLLHVLMWSDDRWVDHRKSLAIKVYVSTCLIYCNIKTQGKVENNWQQNMTLETLA